MKTKYRALDVLNKYQFIVQVQRYGMSICEQNIETRGQATFLSPQEQSSKQTRLTDRQLALTQ